MTGQGITPETTRKHPTAVNGAGRRRSGLAAIAIDGGEPGPYACASQNRDGDNVNRRRHAARIVVVFTCESSGMAGKRRITQTVALSVQGAARGL